MTQQNFPIPSASNAQSAYGMSPLGPLGPLETALQGSQAESQSAIEAALNRLTRIEQSTREAMSRGVSPSDFTVLCALSSACEAARQVLEHAATLRSSFYPTQGK